MTLPEEIQEAAGYIDDVLFDLPIPERLVLLRHLEGVMGHLVKSAIQAGRDEGMTWEEVGECLQTTRMGAWNRAHGRPAGSKPLQDGPDLFS